jgi:hypothetical protein
MKINNIYICLCLIVAGACLHAPADIVFDMTMIGNPGNAPDRPYPIQAVEVGAVDYVYHWGLDILRRTAGRVKRPPCRLFAGGKKSAFLTGLTYRRLLYRRI